MDEDGPTTERFDEARRDVFRTIMPQDWRDFFRAVRGSGAGEKRGELSAEAPGQMALPNFL